jgi:hypothetical protein
VIKGSLEDTSHFGRRFIPSGFRCENSEYADIPALSRLDGQAPQRLKLRSYSLREPDTSFYHTRIGFCKELTTWPVPQSRPYFRKDDWQRSQAESQMPPKYLNLIRSGGTDGSSEADQYFSSISGPGTASGFRNLKTIYKNTAMNYIFT